MFDLFKKEEESKNLSIRLGDWLYDNSQRIAYDITYPLFSIIRASWRAIQESWKDAG